MHGADQHVGNPAHDRSFELLPWFHNGSLEPAEHRMVQKHVGECLLCTRELRRLDQLARVIATPTAEHASAQAYARLARRIEARPRAPFAWVARMFGALRGAIEPLPLASGTALLVLSAALLSTIVLSGAREERAREQPFQTLGYNTVLPSELSRPLMRVVLSDDLGAAGLADWLARHQAEVVDGPSAIGVLTVRVATGQRVVNAVIDDIRADAQTLFVEPVDIVGTRPDRRR